MQMWNKWSTFLNLTFLCDHVNVKKNSFSKFHLSFRVLLCVDKVRRLWCRAAAEAGLTGEHHVRGLWRDPTGDEEGKGLPGSVCQGGCQ